MLGSGVIAMDRRRPRRPHCRSDDFRMAPPCSERHRICDPQRSDPKQYAHNSSSGDCKRLFVPLICVECVALRSTRSSRFHNGCKAARDKFIGPRRSRVTMWTN
jgi:hypothetical protein